MKEIIAVDVDDVIADESEGVLRFTAEKYGHKNADTGFQGAFSNYWEDRWMQEEGITKEEADRRFEAFLASPVKDELKLVDGALRAITELKKCYDLVVVTSRFGRQLETTEPWLEKHFPQTFRQVAFVATWGKDKQATKATIAKEIGASYLIDDNPEHCALAAAQGVTALLFGEHGWTKSVPVGPDVVPVKNWQEVLDYFDGRG